MAARRHTQLETRLADALRDLIETFGLDEIIDTEEQATALQHAQDLLGGMS